MTGLEYILLICGLALVVYLWLDSARARELATAICRAACARYGYQFLDDTVSLWSLKPRRTTAGIRLRRVFTFDFSVSGATRLTGEIVLLGTAMESLDFGLDVTDEAGRSAAGDRAPRHPRIH